jgi:hypothetical protein
MAEVCQFIKAVAHHWVAGITGGIVAVVITISATFFQPLPKQIVFAAIFGYFIIAAFLGWREQYRRANLINKPLELREKLDLLAKQGEHLLDLWLKHHQPAIESGRWKDSVERFVREHFKISQIDAFMDYRLDLEQVRNLENQARRGVVFQT